jgi:Domain of unknown function (DUF6894)
MLITRIQKVGAMARYFFHFENGSGIFQDDMGEVFGNVEEVKTHATIVAGELARNARQWVGASSLLVTDAAGEVLFRVPLIDLG